MKTKNLSQLSDAEKIVLSKQWKRFQRKKAKGLDIFSGELVAVWKREFMAKHKISSDE